MRLPHSINLKKTALALAISCKVAVVDSVAWAAEGDVIRPYASATYFYDSNLRRFSTEERSLAATGRRDRSDTFIQSQVGIILDKKISQQNFYVDVNVNKTKFDRATELDNDGKTATARWDWQLGSRLHGKIEGFHKEALVPFSDFRGITQNLRTENRKIFELIWRFHPSWQLRTGVADYDVEYSATEQRAAALNETSQNVGIDYLATDDDLIGIVYRHARGDRPVAQRFGIFLIDNSYDQNEIKARVQWKFSGKSHIDFLGGIVERKHDDLSQRDFRVWNSRLDYRYSMTGKTNFGFSAWQDNNARSFVTTTYTQNRGLSTAVNWLATSKISLQGALRYEEMDFKGDLLFNQERVDKNKTAALNMTYRPTQSFSINSSLRRVKRDSNLSGAEFTSTSISITGQYEF
ncbi:putative exosortase B-associated extracellular polysaccharide biosynthesis transporter EpsL [Methylobacillus arboreus]|uniref:XrtB/PEP-CTERM-associated polysaccharide biosynthesis outer membrane protein EpsL n=1 Tax=Methylobacillus arboreus TaxID=755170 RepID=UPI001E489698|nr:XrtB/PEP-CTERM-associated polysaccharide biosynthesis outer membrane protein EpsL [Methylobacillus arboreus]MCB5189209.1 putative exosortase B-associated extracellular polysaccharide biosynthesis transporter EpsL [Methylobacillus arboreus]